MPFCETFLNKVKSSFHCMTDWRNTDAILRGIARGISAQTLINTLGKLIDKDLHTAASISAIPIAAITICTSRILTEFSDNQVTRDTEANLNQTASEDTHLIAKKYKKSVCLLLIDAFARGISRADAVITTINLIGYAAKYDLELPATVLGASALILATWSSYRLSTRNTSLVQQTLTNVVS